MKCNVCNIDMVKGEAAVKYTGWGMFFFGASYKHLFFKAQNAGPDCKQLILKNNNLATAYKCNQCGSTTIMPDGEKRNLVHW